MSPFFSTNAKAKASINNIEPSIPALLHADISTCEIKSGLNESIIPKYML